MRLPEAALLDTSVLLRFFHDHRDEQQRTADALAEAWLEGRTSLLILDLSVYEFVNVLVRRLGRGPEQAEQDTNRLFDLGLTMVGCDRELAVQAAGTAASTGLSGYDAAFVAAAKALGLPLVTADERLARLVDEAHVRTLASLGGST